MNCSNCGYLHFKITKKCPSCNSPLRPGKSPFDIGLENGFTIFEGMADNNGYASMESVATATALADEDYSQYGDYQNTPPMEDFDLDLSEAQSSNGSNPAPAGYFTDIGPDDFELDLSEAVVEQGMIATPMEGVESFESAEGSFADARPSDVDDLGIETISDTDEEEMDVEGLGFNTDSSIPDMEVSPDDLDLDLSVDPDVEIDGDMTEPEIDLEPEATVADIEPASDESVDANPEVEVDSETSLDDFELPPETELELSLPEEDEPSLELSPNDDSSSESEIALVDEDIELDLEQDLSDEPNPAESASEEESADIEMDDLRLELEDSGEEDDRKD